MSKLDIITLCRKANHTNFKLLSWFLNPKQSSKYGLQNFKLAFKKSLDTTGNESFTVFTYFKTKLYDPEDSSWDELSDYDDEEAEEENVILQEDERAHEDEEGEEENEEADVEESSNSPVDDDSSKMTKKRDEKEERKQKTVVVEIDKKKIANGKKKPKKA